MDPTRECLHQLDSNHHASSLLGLTVPNHAGHHAQPLPPSKARALVVVGLGPNHPLAPGGLPEAGGRCSSPARPVRSDCKRETKGVDKCLYYYISLASWFAIYICLWFILYVLPNQISARYAFTLAMEKNERRSFRKDV